MTYTVFKCQLIAGVNCLIDGGGGWLFCDTWRVGTGDGGTVPQLV